MQVTIRSVSSADHHTMVVDVRTVRRGITAMGTGTINVFGAVPLQQAAAVHIAQLECTKNDWDSLNEEQLQ